MVKKFQNIVDVIYGSPKRLYKVHDANEWLPQMLEGQTEVPHSVVGPVLKLLVALADTKVPSAKAETADSMRFPFKTHRKKDNANDGLIGAPPECFDVSSDKKVSQKCRPSPYPQFTDDIFDLGMFGGLDGDGSSGGSSRVSRYAAPDQSIFDLKPGICTSVGYCLYIPALQNFQPSLMIRKYTISELELQFPKNINFS